MAVMMPLEGNTEGIALIITETVFLFLDFVAVGMRLWARKLRNKSLELNDYTILVALFLMTGRYVNEVLVVLIGGLGLHILEVEEIGGLNAVLAFGKMAFVDDMLWITLVGLIKISILDLYTAIFRTPWFVKTARALLYLCIVVAIAFILERALICRPVAFNWDTTIPGGVCGSTSVQYVAIVSIDLVIDVFILSLPMPVLWGLKMPLMKRIAISAVFGIGFFICAVCAVRLKFVLVLDYSDPTYSLAEFGIFAALEPLLGIINACLPVLPVVFKKMLSGVKLGSKWKFTYKDSSNGTTTRTKRASKMNTSQTDDSSFVRLKDEPNAYPLKALSEEELARQSHDDGKDCPITMTQVVVVESAERQGSIRNHAF